MSSSSNSSSSSLPPPQAHAAAAGEAVVAGKRKKAAEDKRPRGGGRGRKWRKHAQQPHRWNKASHLGAAPEEEQAAPPEEVKDLPPPFPADLAPIPPVAEYHRRTIEAFVPEASRHEIGGFTVVGGQEVLETFAAQLTSRRELARLAQEVVVLDATLSSGTAGQVSVEGKTVPWREYAETNISSIIKAGADKVHKKLKREAAYVGCFFCEASTHAYSGCKELAELAPSITRLYVDWRENTSGSDPLPAAIVEAADKVSARLQLLNNVIFAMLSADAERAKAAEQRPAKIMEYKQLMRALHRQMRKSERDEKAAEETIKKGWEEQRRAELREDECNMTLPPASSRKRIPLKGRWSKKQLENGITVDEVPLGVPFEAIHYALFALHAALRIGRQLEQKLEGSEQEMREQRDRAEKAEASAARYKKRYLRAKEAKASAEESQEAPGHALPSASAPATALEGVALVSDPGETSFVGVATSSTWVVKRRGVTSFVDEQHASEKVLTELVNNTDTIKTSILVSALAARKGKYGHSMTRRIVIVVLMCVVALGDRGIRGQQGGGTKTSFFRTRP